jgi:hypothetical protein
MAEVDNDGQRRRDTDVHPTLPLMCMPGKESPQ